MVKFREDFKVVSWVFDKSTLQTLDKLKKQGYLDELITVVSPGKEACVFVGKMQDEYVAVKIYAIESAIFIDRLNYIFGDPRFGRISKRRRVLINYWVKKEYLNLLKAWELGIRCPKPITHKNNVLIMEFIGKGIYPAPRARDVPPEGEQIREWARKIFNWVNTYWNEGDLVHGDLSEWNILNYDGEPVLIDFSLGVLKDHPNSIEFLKRDIYNLCRFFRKLGLDLDENLIFKKVLANEKIKISEVERKDESNLNTNI